MTNRFTKLTRNRAGQDALTLIYAAALVQDETIAEDIRASAGVLIEISDDAALAREYDQDRKEAVTSLMVRRTLRAAHQGHAATMIELMTTGPERVKLILGHLSIVGEQFPPAPLFADTPLVPGQRCVLIADGAATTYEQGAVPGRLDRIGDGPAVLVAQNSDGSVMITNEDGGEPRRGVLRLSQRFPELAPQKDDQADGPSSGP